MTPKASASEARLRDGYPPLLRALGVTEGDIETVMAGYDDPVVRTTCPVSAAYLWEADRRFRAREDAKTGRL